MHKLEYVGRWISPSGDLDVVRNVSIALLESRCTTRMYPENP
jgi:hypothetical protein